MADDNWIEESFSNPYANPDPLKQSGEWSDYPKGFGSRALGMIGDFGAGARALAESNDDPDSKQMQAMEILGRTTQELFGRLEDKTIESLSPASKRDLQSTFTDPAFWSLNSFAMKGSTMAPDVVAAVVPSVLFPGAATAAAIAAMQGGAFSAAAVVDDLYDMTDSMSDEQLQAQAPFYRNLIKEGADPADARAQYNEMLRGARPAIVGAIGAITNAFGPAGQAARVAGGASGSALAGGAGLAGRTGAAFAEGAVSEGIQEGSQDYYTQEGAVEGGLQDDIDLGRVAESAAGGAVLGGVLGGGIGAIGGRSKAEPGVDDALVDQALGNTGVPGATPTPAPPSASGATATPGVTVTPPVPVTAETVVPSTPVEAGPTVAEQLQARKKAGVDYTRLTPEQQATVTAGVEARGLPTSTVAVVEPAAPDAAQAAAITASKKQQTTVAPVPEVTPEVVPEVAPVPVTPEGNTAPISEVPAVETPQPVVDTAPVVEPAPAPALAEPATIATPTPEVAVAPVRTGPRVLEDVSVRGQQINDSIAAENAARVQDNIKQMETPVDAAPVGRNRTAAELDERAKVREGAAMITKKYPPADIELGLMSQKPKDVVAARKMIMERAKVISQEAEALGLKLPKAFRDNSKADEGYNPETLLLMEARRLATRPTPKPADYVRFQNRELDVRTDNIGQAVAERRAEGEAANRQTSEVQADTMTDAEVPVDRMDPEAQLIAAEEAGLAPKLKATKDRVAKSQEVPASVEKALDEAMYTTPSADRKAPVVETKKVRKLVKPDSKPAATVSTQADRTIAGSKKLDELKARIEAKRQPSEPTKLELAPPMVTAMAKVKARVEAARQKTNTSPTPAQAVTGNYSKGRVSINGVGVAIENPKGTIRTNKDPNGPKWSVKLPADYGYLEGTRGADGDPIDVYLGADHDASYVYVVDQLDLDSRGFDEHKVMMGFKNEQDALRAYDKAFSDGMGMMRVGDLRKMTHEEFKAWADSDPKDRSGMSSELAAEARSLLIESELEQDIYREAAYTGVVRDGYVMDPITLRVAKPVSTRSASDVIWSLDLSNLTGAARVMAGTARAQLSKLVGDVDVHFLADDDLARLAGRADDDPPFGYHVLYGKGEKHVIFVRQSLMDNPDKLRHTVLHEATHAATVKAVVSDRALHENIARLGGYIAHELNVGQYSADEINAMRYGLAQPKEFIAEAFSNPRFQEILATMPVPENVAAFLKLDSGVRNMWDALIHAVRKALGLPKGTVTMLDAAIRVTEMSMKPRMAEVDAMSALTDRSFLKDNIREALASITTRPDLAPTKGNPHLLGLRTLDNIARMADRYFRGNNPVRQVANIIEGQRVAAIREFDRAAPTIQKLYALSKKYNGKVWQDFTSLVHDETMAGVYADRPLADQKHISKKGTRDSWMRAQHPDLAARFDALPDDLKAARQEAMDYFRDKQNEVALKLIRNRVVTMFDTTDPEGLAQRIHDGTVTDADKALLGEAYDAIAAAGVLSKIDGPYFPLMRRGNFVVKGRYKVTSPGNGTKISDNEFEFADKKDAEDFASSQGGRPTTRTVYVDKTTGETTATVNGSTVRLTANDFNAEPRYRVVVQDRHMEMFDTMREARARVAELRAKGIDTDDAVPRSFENYGIQADALSVQMRRLATVMERRADARNMTPEQKKELLGTLNEVSLSMMGSTRIQSRSLPRQYVQGASKDLVRNTTDYAHAMGNYVAKLDYRPQLDQAMEDLNDVIKAAPQDGFSAGRTAVQNELIRRITTTNPASENKGWNSVSSRILSMSFIDKLMSPSYSVINATQPMMITAPYLAGQYGVGKAYAAMSKAYNDIGSLAAIRHGFADTVAKMKPGNTIVPTDPVSLIRARLKNPGEQAMIDILVDRGIIDTDSGLEVSKIVQDTKGIVGKLDGGIGYLEGIARQMPKTIEAMNRTVAALAAYRLEMGRSGDVARAVQFAQDTVNMTQFNYSSSNASPYMNHPVLRLMLQFKKYGIGMYQFMGEQAALAIRNENPGDRARAIKSLSYTIGMHVLMAGAMGLPTEPIKLVVTAANGLGITDWGWGDVEDAQREAMADLFGKQFGEIVSRGAPRALGIDLSSRMGIDTLMGPFGEPRSNEAQDWKAYVWDTVAGAPAGLVTDWAKGVNDLAEGDVVRAAERLVPIKIFADSIKAYRTFTEGTISETTGKKIMEPYSVLEASARAFGFAPARESEAYERSGTFYRNRDQGATKRTEFQKEWTQANGAARGRIWKEIQKWNRGQPVDARLSLSDLRDYQKRLKSDMKETKDGIRATRRDKHLLERTDRTYNFTN